MNRGRLKKIFTGFLVGAFLISFPISTNAKRLHEPEVEASSKTREENVEIKNSEAEITPPDEIFYGADFSVGTKISSVSVPDEIFYGSDFTSETFSTKKIEKLFESPQNFSDDSIMGTPVATQRQCVKYLLRNNPHPNLGVSAEEIVAYYYEEGQREGIRPDLAFAQALKETGFFRYGGDVVPEQNNYCGLGTTGGGVRGTYFASPQIGVRAHIQHLLAYTSTRMPSTAIVDPRYQLVRARYGTNILSKWYDLNGRWAVPGYHYGQDILKMLQDILVQ